jgi:hypothetical protein
MEHMPPLGFGDGTIEPGSRDDPHVFDTTDPYFEDDEDRGRRLIECMPLALRRLIEVYRLLEAQNREDLAVLFVRDHPKPAEPEEEDDEIPADFVDDLSEFDDNPPAWIRRQQGKHVGLVVCYVDSRGREDWDIPSTALLFAVPWPEDDSEPERRAWNVRLPGVTGESPNRSGGCRVLTESDAVELVKELRDVVGESLLENRDR